MPVPAAIVPQQVVEQSLLVVVLVCLSVLRPASTLGGLKLVETPCEAREQRKPHAGGSTSRHALLRAQHALKRRTPVLGSLLRRQRGRDESPRALLHRRGRPARPFLRRLGTPHRACRSGLLSPSQPRVAPSARIARRLHLGHVLRHVRHHLRHRIGRTYRRHVRLLLVCKRGQVCHDKFGEHVRGQLLHQRKQLRPRSLAALHKHHHARHELQASLLRRRARGLPDTPKARARALRVARFLLLALALRFAFAGLALRLAVRAPRGHDGGLRLVPIPHGDQRLREHAPRVWRLGARRALDERNERSVKRVADTSGGRPRPVGCGVAHASSARRRQRLRALP